MSEIVQSRFEGGPRHGQMGPTVKASANSCYLPEKPGDNNTVCHHKRSRLDGDVLVWTYWFSEPTACGHARAKIALDQSS